MTTTLVQNGDTLSYTCTGNVTKGALLTFTAMVGVALDTGVTGDIINVALRGVFTVTRTAASTLTAVGANAYATSTGAVVATTTSNVFCGKLFAAAATADTTAQVAINFGSESV